MMLQAKYLSDPFPHCVVDGYFSDSLLEDVLAEWPEKMSVRKSGNTSKKNIHSKITGEATKRVIGWLNSKDFLEELEALTGITDLVADPYLVGGGLHEIPPGGFLNHHVDFNWNERIHAVRKINLLLYLNKDWTANGDLELLKDGKVVKSISPAFNRMVIFNTSEDSWHGHPQPLTGDRPRRSIAVYYYRKENKPEFAHTTIYGTSPSIRP